MEWDLGLNLISEIIGIAITVFLVDKIIQKREKEKLIPSKNALYSRLINHIDNVLINSPPSTLNSDFYFYEFGDVIVTTTEEDFDFSNLEFNKKFLQEVKKYSSKISLDNRIKVLNELLQEKDDIDKMLSGSSSLLEPELFSIIMKLQRTLSDAKSILKHIHFTKGKRRRESSFSNDIALSLTSIIFFSVESASNAKKWILQHASNKTKSDDFIAEQI